MDESQLVFNSTGSIIFGIVHTEPTEVDDRFFNMFGNYFRTFDSTNYEVFDFWPIPSFTGIQVISTHDTKKPLLDLCCGHSDNYIGVIEVSRTDEDTNFFKLYEIGRNRNIDEEEEDEQDEQVTLVNGLCTNYIVAIFVECW